MNETHIMLILLFAFVLLFFITSILKKRKKDNRKIIKKLPISYIKDAKKVSGLIKVKGTLVEIKTIQSYLTKKQCIGYDYKAMKWVTTDRFDNDHSSKRWKTIESIEECYDFYIQDQTGKIKVKAKDISISLLNVNQTNKKISGHRHTENLLLQDDKEYILIGTATYNKNNELIIKKAENEFDIRDPYFDKIYKSDLPDKISKYGLIFMLLLIGLVLFFISRF